MTELGTVNGKPTWDHRKVYVFEYDDQVQATAPRDPITCGRSLAIIDAATGDYVIQAQG